MSLMGIQRNRSGNSVRSTLALVLVAMLNLAFQPCAMAMSMEADTDHPCPHCPESAHHDPDAQAAPKGGIPGCDDVEAYNRDARNGQSTLKDSVDDSPVAIVDLFYSWMPEHATGTFDCPRSPDVHPGGPPLNVLYCVYLN
jgi:hypothetical protein